MNKLLIVKHHDSYDNTGEFFCREILDNSQISKYFHDICEEIRERCSINDNFDIIIIDIQNNNNILIAYKGLIRAGFEQILNINTNR